MERQKLVAKLTGMRIDELHLNQLRLIDALAQTSNLGEAAKEIGMTQSAASHALARLRVGLEDPLFVRTAEGMRPTPYGIRLTTCVRDALRLLRKVWSDPRISSQELDAHLQHHHERREPDALPAEAVLADLRRGAGNHPESPSASLRRRRT